MMILTQFFSVVIAVIIQKAMGDLANDLSYSVSSLNLITKKSCFFPTGHYKEKKWIINGFSIMISALALTFFIMQEVSLANTEWSNVFTNKDDIDTFGSAEKAFKMFSNCAYILYTPLSVFVTYYFFAMRHTLSECTTEKLKDKRNELIKYFSVFLAAFVF
jgi:hypothetical protein